MAVSGRESPSEQHYSLKWNDYSVKLVTAFQSLRDEEDFVDVTVACDGHQYSAHKMVLSACSPYFRSMLRANPCQHPIVILKDVGHNEMERLLEFMYNGEVNIAQDQLAAFLRTAENLKIRGLAGSSDDMEQIYNRDYGNMSTSDKLFNQQQQQQLQQQQNSTSVSAIASTNTSINNSSGPHNEHNHQGLNGNNGFAKEESDGLSLSGGGGLSVPTTDCYSPAPKKRKLVMLNNTDQDCITDGEAALDGSGDVNSVAALVSQAGPLGVEVKCLSRDLKAEPCEAGTEAGLTAGGEAVYSSSAGGDDTASQDQILAPHLYTIGVGGSTGASGGATHQDLNSAAQHNDQGGMMLMDAEDVKGAALLLSSHLFGGVGAGGGGDGETHDNDGNNSILGMSSLLDESSISGAGGRPSPGPNLESGLRWTSMATSSLNHQAEVASENQCSFCLKSFSNRGSMTRHMRDQHLEPNNTVACDICGKICKNRNCLITHRSVAHNARRRTRLSASYLAGGEGGGSRRLSFSSQAAGAAFVCDANQMGSDPSSSLREQMAGDFLDV